MRDRTHKPSVYKRWDDKYGSEIGGGFFGNTKQKIQSLFARGKAGSNLNKALKKRYKSDPKSFMPQQGQGWKSVPKERRNYLVNDQANLMAGYMQPKSFIEEAYQATNAPQLQRRMSAIDAVKREAQEQLTPQELQKYSKNLLNDRAIKKIHERLINQSTNMGWENLLRRK